MTRNIKFRAWDEDGYMVYPPFSLVFRDKEIVLTEPDGTFGTVGSGIVALMQSTDLFDKNGKEIYEGDILRFTFPLAKGKTKPITHYHQVLWNVKNGAWWMKRGATETQLGSHVFTHEVVGNIFADKKLLKV